MLIHQKPQNQKQMQKSYNNKKVLCFGEVLWDVLPEGKKIGGAPLNVAYHLRKLGVDVTFTSRIGEDALGKEIQSVLKEKGLSESVLQTDINHPTSTVEARIHANHEVTYNIVENVAWDFIEYNHKLKVLASQASYLVYGSLITRNEISRNTLYQLLDSPLIKVLDVNLRKPFYSKELLQKLLISANIVKMNEAELQIISEWFHYGDDDKEKMKILQNTFDIDSLIVTYGAKGAYLLHNNAIYFEAGYQIEVADTIGSGDAFLAGFLTNYIMDKSPPEALKTANDMGAFIAQKPGGCPEYEKTEIKMYIQSTS